MNRLGFRHDNLRRSLPELLGSRNLTLDGVYTHFASADVPESGVFGDQRDRFEQALRHRPRAWWHASCSSRVQQRRAAS